MCSNMNVYNSVCVRCATGREANRDGSSAINSNDAADDDNCVEETDSDSSGQRR